MFDDILKRLRADKPEPLTESDARTALGALLVRIARSDGDYAQVEADRITRILELRYDMPENAANELRLNAEKLEAEAPDTVRFTREIKDAVAHEDRAGIIEDLWELVLADGTRDHHEDSILRLVAPLLGVNDRDSALARQRVQARNG